MVNASSLLHDSKTYVPLRIWCQFTGNVSGRSSTREENAVWDTERVGSKLKTLKLIMMNVWQKCLELIGTGSKQQWHVLSRHLVPFERKSFFFAEVKCIGSHRYWDVIKKYLYIINIPIKIQKTLSTFSSVSSMRNNQLKFHLQYEILL